ncbi:glycosyltransferase [Methylophaga sp. UBA3192]|uniref:glycosyltransferase n=1 Tax=Methylophaga sp. UBA3192 TaxID=1946882 RepID=UPI0025E60320|nr:glycosyltransferase [Methylophaga sp. UBA3192]
MTTIKQDGTLTIGITSYNYGRYIADAIESVINQTSPHWKLMIYDNGSTDNTFEVVEPYLKDPRVSLFVHKKNIGASANSLYAIRHADSQYFSFLQADDFLEHTFVEDALFQFKNHPESPFVFFNWQQYIEQTKTRHGHNRSPFSSDRSGPTYIGPFLTVFNFVPLHMAAFRTECLQYGYEAVAASPLKQVLEQFLLKLLEDVYGIGCYTGTIGGVWRRHDEQITTLHMQNYVAYLEEPVERQWYIKQSPSPNYIKVFMALATTIYRLTPGSLLSTAEWMTHTEGQRYAEGFGVPVDEKREQIKRVVLVVVLKVTTYCSMTLYEISELISWIKSLGHEFTETSLKQLLLEIMSTEGEALINLSEIEQICQFCFKQALPQQINPRTEVMNELIFSQLFPIQKQTGMPLLTIAQSMLDKKKDLFTSFEDRELFLISVCKAAFDAIKQRCKNAINHDDEAEIKHLRSVLLDHKRIDQHKTLALQLRAEISEWQLDKDYQRWINNHALLEIDAQLHAERMMGWSMQPKFHLYMFMFEGEQTLLANTIDSLSKQFYHNWRLTVIADGPAPDAMFEELGVLEWISFPDGQDPYSFLNHVIMQQPDGWTMFVPAGVQFEAHTFLSLGDYIEQYPQQKIFYTDDDLVSVDGVRHSPRFKPDFSLDMLRSTDYIGVVLCEASLFKSLGGFDMLPAHENYGLTLKAFELSGPTAIGHISDVLLHLPESIQGQANQPTMMMAVEQHLQRLGVKAYLEPGLVQNSVRVEYEWPSLPLVSIIIPTKDKIEFLRPCIDSLLQKTTYSNYELIIVDNQSEDPDIQDYFAMLKEHHGEKISVLKYPHPFNYAAISNLAAKASKGDYLLFLNNDTEVLHAEWLERMIRHAQRPEVGIVGARLVFPETRVVQHAGVVLGMDTIADHLFWNVLDIQEPGYMDRAHLDQNFSAVTAACLVIRKSLYEDVGGMDEENLTVYYNDVDLCLKVREKEYLVTWTPFAVLVHHGSVSQKSEFASRADETTQRIMNERSFMLKKWLPQLANDPFYNRNLSLSSREMQIEAQMPTNWDTNFHDRERILGLPLPGGSGDYRVIQPFSALSHAALAQCEFYRFNQNIPKPIAISEYARIAPDSVLFHAALNDLQLKQLEQLKEFMPDVFRIYSIDDLLTNVPEQSPAAKEIKRHFADAKSRMRRALERCDRLIVSTQPLAELCLGMIDDIRVVPNRLPKEPWLSVTSLSNQSDKPRVGWAGAQQHQGDLAIMCEVVKATADEVDWIFMGMCPEDIKPYVHEYHDFVPIADYPAKLASLNLDLAVAPLEIHPFNESKSNLRLLEYGVLGWPVICTDIYPYRTNNPPVIYVQNQVDEWVAAIRQILADKAALVDAGSALKAWVLEHYMLEDHLDEWLSALARD